MERNTSEPRVLAAAHAGIVGQFFVAGLVVGLLAAAMFAAFAQSAPARTAASYHTLVWLCIAVAGVFAIAWWWVRNAPITQSVQVAAWAALLLIGAVIIALGEGIHSLAAGFCSLLICVSTVTVSQRAGGWMSLVCMISVFALAFAEHQHWLRGAVAVAASPLLMRLVTLLMLIGLSFTIGLMMSRLIGNHLSDMRAREQRYRTLFEQSPAGLVLHDAGQVIDANHLAEALIGQADSSASTTIAPHLGELAARTRTAMFAHAATLANQPVGRASLHQELVLAATEDSVGTRVLELSAVRVDGEHGPVTLSMMFDESQRYAAELESRHVQAQLTHLVAASPDCVLLSVPPEGRVLMTNARFEALSGFSSAEIIGRSVADLGLWRDEAARLRFRTQLDDTGSVSDFAAVFVTKAGASIHISLAASTFEFDGQRFVVTHARDVTENERTRREQQAILGTAAVGIAMTQRGRISRANAACEQMFGYSPGAMEGLQGSALWLVANEPSDRRAVLEETLQRAGYLDFECELRRCDGSAFWCRARGRAVDPEQLSTSRLVWVFEDITLRRRMEQALESAKEAAEAASLAKSAFLANTSHEIRTPLNGLIGLTRLALRPQTDDEECQRYLPQILDSAESLAEIMGDILDMSKVDAGKLELEEVAFDLHALLQAAHETYAAVAAGRGIDCTLEIANDVPRFVHGDAVRTRQILNNYLTNALKFTASGTIEIRATCATRAPGATSNHVRLAVRDTGIGIDESVKARLFQPFAQADDSTTRRFGGTGLGLSICREIATVMGGAVGVQSALGKGSTFWAELPFAIASTVQAQQLAPSVTLAGARVLVAEDNPVNMIIAATLLQEWAIDVVEVVDGQAAIATVDAAAARAEPFDLVLMDLQMPRMDGFVATRELRKRYDAAHLPIVALTAGALVAERDAALACGMNAFLTKPINETSLKRTLVELLAARTPGGAYRGVDARAIESEATGMRTQGP